MNSERQELLRAALIGLAHERTKIDAQVNAINTELGVRKPGRPKLVRRKMSAAGRAAISVATKKRWAAFRKAKKVA